MQSGPLRALLLAVLFSSSTAFAQKPAVSPRVTAAIDEAKLTVLKGNTHPLARAEFDCGAAPANHRLNRMLLVRREERFLCLSCHVNPNAVNVPHGRLSFQTRGDCTRCHSSIHGSNFDANFLH